MTAQPGTGPPPSAHAATRSAAGGGDSFDVGAEKLMLLVEASGELIGSLDTKQALPRVLDLSRQLIDADAYALWDYDAAAHRWAVVASHGLSPEYLEQSNIAVTDTTPAMHGTIVAPDVNSEPLLSDRVQGYRAEGIRSILVVALSVRGEAHGTITFYYRTPHAFTQQEIRIAEALASVASAAVSVSRFYDEQQRVNAQLGDLNQRLTLIAQCSATLSEPLEQTGDGSAKAAFSAALKKIAHRIVPAFAEVCVVDVFESPDVTHRVETAVIAAVDTEALLRMRVRNWRIAPGTSVTVSERIMSGLPVMVPALDDAWREACAPDADQLDAGNRLGITSFVMCPMVARGRVIGALSCGAVLPTRAFTDVDVAMLLEIARRAAHALDTTRL
jgi:GAF domain-containing protein